MRLQRLLLHRLPLKRHCAWAAQLITSLIYPKRHIACTSDLRHSTQRTKFYQLWNFHFWVNFPIKSPINYCFYEVEHGKQVHVQLLVSLSASAVIAEESHILRLPLPTLTFHSQYYSPMQSQHCSCLWPSIILNLHGT